MRAVTGRMGERRDKMRKSRLLIVAMVAVGLLLAGCGSDSGTTGDGGQSAGASAVDCSQFLEGFSNLTEVQQQSYFSSYKGKKVRWIGEVAEVTSEGGGYIVSFDADSGWVDVGMDGSQKAVVSDTDKGDLVVYEGVIDSYYEKFEMMSYTTAVGLKSGRIVEQVLQPVWEKEFRYFHTEIVTDGEACFAALDSASVYYMTAVDGATGNVLWKKPHHELDSNMKQDFAGYSEEYVFYYYFDGQWNLLAIDRDTGDTAWSDVFTTGLGELQPYAQAAAEERVTGVVSGDTGAQTQIGGTQFKLDSLNFGLTATRLSDGRLLWEKNWPQSIKALGSTEDLLIVFNHPSSAGAAKLQAFKVSDV